MTLPVPPLLLRPIYVLKPWGGRRMQTELGRTDLPDGPVGESWEAVDTDEARSYVDGGPYDGRPLREVLGRPFPLLLKVLDAQEDLSVQVHPDGDAGPAKEEAWVALADGGAVATGDVARRLAEAGTLPAAGTWIDALERRALEAGSPDGARAPTLVHVPPRTVHSILAGSLLFEVQNPVDVTWRLDDFGRAGTDGKPRALHLEEARPLLERGAEPPAGLSDDGRRLDAQRFWIRLHRPGASAGPGGSAAFFLADGKVEWGDGESLEVPAGRTVVLTESVQALRSPGWIIVAGV